MIQLLTCIGILAHELEAGSSLTLDSWTGGSQGTLNHASHPHPPSEPWPGEAEGGSHGLIQVSSKKHVELIHFLEHQGGSLGTFILAAYA